MEGERSMRSTLQGMALAACALASAMAMAGQEPASARFQGEDLLVVELAQPARTWDNAVRGDLVRIRPALPARCNWDSDTRLACHLQTKAAPATRYRVELAGPLQMLDGPALPSQVLWAETRRPTVRRYIEKWEGGVPSIVLVTDMPVASRDLRAVLCMQVDGKPVDAALRPLPQRERGLADRYFGLEVPAAARGSELTVDVVPGLRARPGPLPGQQDQRLLAARLREPFELRGVSCAGRDGPVSFAVHGGAVVAHCTPGEAVQLEFTQTLDSGSRTRIKAGLPAGIGVEEVWYGSARLADKFLVALARPIRLDALQPNSRLDLRLDAAIRSVDGEALPPTTVRIDTGDAPPQVRASRGDALVADGRRPPVQVEVLNAASVPLDVEGIGRGFRREAVQASGMPRGATRVESAVAARTLAEGGWVRWSAGSRDAGGSGKQVEFAAPGFDLLAVAGRREVLAWANAWDRDAPVAGADVELLWREHETAPPRVAARGRTAGDGTVLLRLPDDIAVEAPTDDTRWDWSGPSWLLRATSRDGRRAVLPVGETGGHGLNTGLAPARRTWGVSDRPLYRAGDTVHYRRWTRERDGVRLRTPRTATATTLRLVDSEQDKTIMEWTATPAADGSVAGELTLPVHLTDATHCIGVAGEGGDTDGTCFFVGTYRAQDLWVEASSVGGVLRDGDRYVADIRAGYFSGGVAAGAEAKSLEVTLWPLPLHEAYPRFAEYTFIDVDSDDVEFPELAGLPRQARLDGDGALHLDVPLAFGDGAEQRPAFGMLGLGASVAPEDREPTVATDEATRYARHDRYVGLKPSPAWFGRKDRVVLEAVVIDASGEEVAADVTVDVEFLDHADDETEQLARCLVRHGSSTPCDFPRKRSGFYLLTARSGDAAPANMLRYVWAGDGGLDEAVDDPNLVVVDASPQRDAPVRALLTHEFERARGLFVLSNGDSILGHEVQALVGTTQSVAIAVQPEWRGRMTLRAFVREAVASETADGYRDPVAMETLEATIVETPLAAEPAPVELGFQPSPAQPGARAMLTVTNRDRKPRSFTLAVVDDALRAQAQRWLPYADPQGGTGFAHWLAFGTGGVDSAGFADWEGRQWRWLLPWANAATAAPLPPPPEQPAVEVEDPMPVDVPVSQRARAYAEGYAGDGQAMTLDRIEVTGSRIRRADLVESQEASAPDPSLPPRDAGEARASTAALAQVRTRFADTALWLPALTLGPGESRRIEVALPDNLTRWRAVAWSTAGADEFAMSEATLEAGLPVEARLQAPVRLYPGDTARIATNVRHVAAEAVTAQASLHVDGPDVETTDAQSLALPARGQGSVATTVAPVAPGPMRLVARAHTQHGHDAVAADVEVASPSIAARKLQAGWVQGAPRSIALPALPQGARDARLQVSLLRGDTALTAHWRDELHRYPHRCWEQILSRAVGAALALERADPAWPDAERAVREAIDNAAVFQRPDGSFTYFADRAGASQHNVVLTAYSVRALGLLAELGHAAHPGVLDRARGFLSGFTPAKVAAGATADRRESLASLAFAASGHAPGDARTLDPLWQQWDRLPLPAMVAAAQALAAAGHPSAPAAVERLLARAPLRGAARTLRLPRRYDEWMSSDAREQCALIRLLGEHPQLAPATTRRELVAGLTDLHAGGVAAVDTQTAATCLVALRDRGPAAGAPAEVRVAYAGREHTFALAQGESRREWQAGAADGGSLQVGANPRSDVPLSYVASLDYVEDARQAQPSALGFQLGRRYEVLRDGEWVATETQAVREGDWLRITLTLETSAPRQFVAITDNVPGGLRPTDPELAGAAPTGAKRLSDEGSAWFATRRLDPRQPRFYAETLPAGRHEVHYFARVGNAGDYLAAPAVAELMYGAATRARTAAARLRMEAAAP